MFLEIDPGFKIPSESLYRTKEEIEAWDGGHLIFANSVNEYGPVISE